MAITPYRSSSDVFPALLDEILRPNSNWTGRLGGMLRTPDADVMESENEIQVMVELPGMRAEEINLDLENNILTIEGEKHEEHQEEKNTWHLSERRYGKFSRSFVLPRDVDSESIQARFENGVLLVTIPKSERARRRRIEVQSGTGQQQLNTEQGNTEQGNTEQGNTEPQTTE